MQRHLLGVAQVLDRVTGEQWIAQQAGTRLSVGWLSCSLCWPWLGDRFPGHNGGV